MLSDATRRNSSQGRSLRLIFSTRSDNRRICIGEAPLSAVLWSETKGAHRKGSHALHFHRNGKEAKVLIRQSVQAAKMLDDGDFRAEQERVHGPGQVGRVIDVQGIDADQG